LRLRKYPKAPTDHLRLEVWRVPSGEEAPLVVLLDFVFLLNLSQTYTVNQTLAGSQRVPQPSYGAHIERTRDSLQDQCWFVFHIIPRLNGIRFISADVIEGMLSEILGYFVTNRAFHRGKHHMSAGLRRCLHATLELL
jgi:hypothetical protein